MEVHGHINHAELFLESDRVFGRTRDSLKIVEPSHLLHRAVGNELGGKVLTNGRVVTAPAMLDQGNHRLTLFDCLCRSPLAPSSRIPPIHDELRHSLWMSYRVF